MSDGDRDASWMAEWVAGEEHMGTTPTPCSCIPSVEVAIPGAQEGMDWFDRWIRKIEKQLQGFRQFAKAGPPTPLVMSAAAQAMYEIGMSLDHEIRTTAWVRVARKDPRARRHLDRLQRSGATADYNISIDDFMYIFGQWMDNLEALRAWAQEEDSPQASPGPSTPSLLDQSQP